MAKYKNVSDRALSVPTVLGPVTVQPGKEVLTAKKFAVPFVKGELLELIPVQKTKKKATPKGE